MCVAAPHEASAVGEQTGRISGRILEAQTSAAVPGATVTASSSVLIGQPQKTTSEEDGRYELVALPPGTYNVEVTYAGIKPVRREVVVRLDETTPLDITWSAELAVTETTTILEERHLTKPDSTQSGTVLSADSQSRIASPRRYQEVVVQVAGVDPLPVGRVLAFNPIVNGATNRFNRYLVDGLDTTDPLPNTFSININFDSISSLEVLTGGLEAQYNSLGGVFNLITQTGSDRWSLDASIYAQPPALSAGKQFGANLFDDTRPFSSIPAETQQLYQANLNRGGPLIEHRLWFNASLELREDQSSIPAGPPLATIQHPPRKNLRNLGRLKLTWAPNQRHRLTLSGSGEATGIDNYSQSNTVHPLAEGRQQQGSVFAVAQWDYFPSSNIDTTVQAGFQSQYVEQGPQGKLGSIDSEYPGYNPDRPRHTVVDPAGTTSWYNYNTEFVRQSYSLQLDPSISLRGTLAGHHDAKLGIQSRVIWLNFRQNVPGGVTYLDSGGGFGEGGICDETTGNGCFRKTEATPYRQRISGYGAGLFLQDRWKPINRLTILPGIRADYGIAENSQGQTALNLWGFGPRFGVAFDLSGDQKTILSGYYGRSNETMTLAVASNADATQMSVTRQWNAATKAFDILVSQRGGSGGYQIDPQARTPPHLDELRLSLRREVFRNSMAAIEYGYRRYSNIWDAVEINQIWDPTGYRVIGYVNGNQETVYKYTTPDTNYRIYHGVDVTLEARPTPNWDFYVAYTLSWLYGPGADEFLGGINGQVNGFPIYSRHFNPRQATFFDGFLRDDERHRLKLRGSYTLHGLSVGVTSMYGSGRALLGKFYFNQALGAFANRRSPQGTEPGARNDPESITEFRTPSALQLNVRVAYDLYEHIGQHLILIADFFNLLNQSQTTELNTSDDQNFGQIAVRAQPFRAQFGLRYVY